MKKILILGAGLMQKPAILAAKKLGVESVVVDANPNALCAPMADRFEPIDLKDREALVKLARSLGGDLSGVFTAGTDFSSSVSYVAEKLGLSAHPFQSALNASDKVRMRTCFKKKNVPSPHFKEVSRSEIDSFCKESSVGGGHFPLVVKPCDNMGGRGCRLVRTKDELFSALSLAVKNSRTARAICEDFMEGDEYSIDAIVFDGTLTITGFADRHVYFPPYFIEMGHSLPSKVSEKIKNELIATFALGIKALGLNRGVAKADIKYTKNGPMIGEIAARLSGGYMSGWTFPYASGIDLTCEAMKIALNLPPDEIISKRESIPWQPHESVLGAESPFKIYEIKTNLFSAERAWISIPGKIKSIEGLDLARTAYGVRDVLPRAKEGDEVDFPRNNVEKCGNIIAVALSREEAKKGAEEAVSRVVLRLCPKNAQTERFLHFQKNADEDDFPPCAFDISEEEPCPFPETVLSSHEIAPFIPEQLGSKVDWNHRSLKKSAELFDSLAKNHGELSGKKLWTALIRGGLQGALYVSDSEE